MAENVTRKYLLVDAYNVINEVEELRIHMDEDLEKAREFFIGQMIEFSHYTREKIILVFDAYLVRSRVEKVEQRQGIEIVFTKFTQTADAYIEARVGELTQKITNEVRVVTKDALEQQIVLGKGALRMLPRELYYEVEFMGRRIKNKYQPEDTGVKERLEDRLNQRSLEALKKISDKNFEY
ncbi:MAG: hypothetical protein AVO33_02315 [delta proteobacterium ML8_F1]|nr:MAG: hypothetical protein AVO33_02315 [delta proteobacterium ML8_F1]